MGERSPYGTTNLDKVQKHIHTLDDSLNKLEESIRERVVEDIMQKMLECFKKSITEIIPSMEEASEVVVLKAVKDPSCMALMPWTEDHEERLEEIIPQKEMLSGSEVVVCIEDLDDLSMEQKTLLTNYSKNLEVAHDTLGRASAMLARLLWSLTRKQLLTVLKASVQLLVQINALENFWKDPTVTDWKLELPEDTYSRVKLTMMLDPTAISIKGETVNSTTSLLADTPAYKILRKFSGGMTQREMQEMFQVWSKQLAACITGRKYMGGYDQKVAAVSQPSKKRKRVVSSSSDTN